MARSPQSECGPQPAARNLWPAARNLSVARNPQPAICDPQPAARNAICGPQPAARNLATLFLIDILNVFKIVCLFDVFVCWLIVT